MRQRQGNYMRQRQENYMRQRQGNYMRQRKGNKCMFAAIENINQHADTSRS